MLSWRRGTLAISQCLALNLHMVLTALVIWFLRWQIRNSKLQVGRLLVAGTLIAEATADRKAGEAHIRVTAQGSLSCAPGKMVIQKKKKAKIISLVQEALRHACTVYGQLPVPSCDSCRELGFLFPRHWLQEEYLKILYPRWIPNLRKSQEGFGAWSSRPLSG